MNAENRNELRRACSSSPCVHLARLDGVGDAGDATPEDHAVDGDHRHEDHEQRHLRHEDAPEVEVHDVLADAGRHVDVRVEHRQAGQQQPRERDAHDPAEAPCDDERDLAAQSLVADQPGGGHDREEQQYLAAHEQRRKQHVQPGQ